MTDKEELREARDRIADALGETEKAPRRMILQVIEARDIEFADALLKDTLDIEADGGVMVKDGTRRRTPGGVFFMLARERLTEEERDSIFLRLFDRNKRHRVKQQYDAFDREQLTALLAEQAPKELIDVRVRIIGRPTEVTKFDTMVVAIMAHTAHHGSIPFGLPPLPEIATTTYTIYIPNQQWYTHESALKKSKPKRLLEIQGVVAYDEEIASMVVYTIQSALRKPKDLDLPAPDTYKETDKTTPKASASAKKNSEPVTLPPPIEMNIPDGVPADIEEKLKGLYRASAQYREKLAEILQKPEDERFGQEMTQKLLTNVEKQINDLIEKHST